jgi:endonuclease/exonuclease/phosphatase family metal-dependent hydrolase
MTWNVENLFRPGGSAGVSDPALYKQKLRNLAAMIVEHAADVVALQEIGDPAALDDLRAELGARYPHQLVSTKYNNNAHPIRVAALVRKGHRPTDATEYYDFPATGLIGVPQLNGVLSTMGRGVLAFTVSFDGQPVRFMAVHLKSKLIEYPNGRFQPVSEDERAQAGGFALLRRTGEAVAVRVWANDWLRQHGQPLVVLGDFNDGPYAATTQIVYGPPDQNLTRVDKGDAWRLVNLARFSESPQPASRIYQHHGELIDHILVSADLARSHPPPQVVIDDRHITSIGDQPTRRKQAVWPDHAPVIATIPGSG